MISEQNGGSRMERITTDVLVAGGGIAGLMAATRAHASGARVVLLGGTTGGSARVSSFSTALDSPDGDERRAFLQDITSSGALLNHTGLMTEMVDRIGPETLFLDEIGVPLHRQGGRLARRQAAGSSQPWAVFTMGMVGVDICRELLRMLGDNRGPTVRQFPGAFLLDLHIQDGAVLGGLAHSPHDQEWIQIDAPAVILATGGAGRLFGNTTNPTGAMGIGHALSLEAGARLIDMEFVSFEPFIMASPANLRGHDLPTTVLREGARLRNGLGQEFIDTTQSPAKDVICRAMVREVIEGRGTPAGAVYYDLREMAPEMISRYVQIVEAIRAQGISAGNAQLEVMPVQHSVVGGIQTGTDTSTSVSGLFAVGETSGGVHGAHRLATCGGTEAIAMGAISGESAARHALCAQKIASWEAQPEFELLPKGLSSADYLRLEKVQAALDQGCGIIRDGSGLEASLLELRKIRDELREEGRMKSFAGRAVMVALAIATPAAARFESRGDHFRTDAPNRDDRLWLGNYSVDYNAEAGDLSMVFQKVDTSDRV
jgi:aspartate oxidase